MSGGLRRLAGLAGLTSGLIFCIAQVASPASAASVCPGANGRIAVSAPRGISFVTAVGRLHSITGGTIEEGQASFSCDGGELVVRSYNGEEDTCPHLELTDSETGQVRFYPGHRGASRETDFPTPHLCDYFPALLADGKLLISASAANGNFRNRSGTYEANVNGTHLRRLFRAGEMAATVDGKWFVATDLGDSLRWLDLLDARGRRVRHLTPVLPRGGSQYLHPGISPDGKWVVYGRDLYTPPPNYSHQYDLFIVRRDGTHRRQLTHDGRSFGASFSPDGRWIVFIQEGDEYQKNVSTLPVRHPNRVRQVTHLQPLVYNLFDPTWLPK